MDKADISVDRTSAETEQQLLHALKGIRYGSVEIIIHDSRIVQIERKEKVRFVGHNGQH